MTALPLGRYRELLAQLLQLNRQTAALRRELAAQASQERSPGGMERFPDDDYRPHFLEHAPSPDDEQRVPGADCASVKSFSSAGSGGAGPAPRRAAPEADRAYSLLSLLSLSGSDADVSECLLEMSRSAEGCAAVRRAGCVPLLVRLVHSDLSGEARERAARALRNVVHARADDKAGRREARVLRLLEHVRDYCARLRDGRAPPGETEDARHPSQSVAALMKLSFDEEHRAVMCRLGGLQALAALVAADRAAHGSTASGAACLAARKYAGMALTNLTFGDGDNKALLCSFSDFMAALVDQLESPDDDMRQVTAAVLRNLSWRADAASKRALREVGAVAGLTRAALAGRREAALKSVLSALWNLTAHCSLNKAELCAQPGALAFLADALSGPAPAVVENAGGILRNVSSHVAVREDYREILRERGCLRVLLQHLKSPSLTVVSNSCGTLWNLSARCRRDQRFLWDHGAVPMLRSLAHSKHKMIAMGSSAALKNLLSSEPGRDRTLPPEPGARLGLPALPTLGARKRRALEQEIDQSLAETCDNIEPERRRPGSARALTGRSSAFGPARSASTRERIRTHSPGFDEIDACDRPVDYGSKYSETEPSGGGRDVPEALRVAAYPSSPESTGPSGVPRAYGDFRETDPDRPTDYSLRYPEDRSEAISEPSEERALSAHEDTVKHFCTEGTPYETPINFSTATSMSDLRGAGLGQSATLLPVPSIKADAETLAHCGEKEACSPEEGAEHDNNIALAETPFRSEFSSGAVSPEKPVNYCEEGTPGYFSRVSSLSSLEGVDKTDEPGEAHEAPGAPPAEPSKVPNYAEETPLMFSRCSSLGSLSGCSGPDRPDDGGSVLSEFSRVTSGCISPSELPDSPTASPGARRRPRSPPLRAVPEDGPPPPPLTPAAPSGATSLSALTIDDEPGAACIRGPGVGHSTPPRDACRAYRTEDTPAVLSDGGSVSDLSLPSLAGDELLRSPRPASDSSNLSAESDYLLAECIRSGMPKKASGGYEAQRRGPAGREEPTSQVSLRDPRRILSSIISTPQAPDEMANYAVEDSPFRPSPGSSLSDLTVHSGGSHARLRRRTPSPASPASVSSASLGSDDGRLLDMAIRAGVPQDRCDSLSSLSSDGELLEQCIASGLPRPRPRRRPSALREAIEQGMPRHCTGSKNGSETSAAAAATGANLAASQVKTLSPPELLDVIHANETSSSVCFFKQENLNGSWKEKLPDESIEATKNSNALLVRSDTDLQLPISISLSREEHSPIRKEQINIKDVTFIPQCSGESAPMSDSVTIKTEAVRLAIAIGAAAESTSCRRPLPGSLTVRRALGLPVMAALDASCLDNVKPPSEMDDILDMDNSMLSVASIMSEDDDVLLRRALPSFDPGRLAIAPDLEGINPPSLFDELTESTLENNGREEDDYCPTHSLALCPDLPPEEETDSSLRTAEAIVGVRLTPRQKRETARERYRTYTIAADLIADISDYERKTSENNEPTILAAISPRNVSPSPVGGRARSSPRQRRLEDRARYRTQTVSAESLRPGPAARDPNIEALRVRLDAKKSLRQKRLENADRYRTRTLDEKVRSSPERECDHLRLAEEASRALDFLQRQPAEESLPPDLECETLSLVSNEDDSELDSIRMKTFTRSFRNYLPVIESPTAVDKCIEKNLKNIDRTANSITTAENRIMVGETEENHRSGDAASLECDQNSGTESADQNRYSDSEAEAPQTKPKPKIMKPEAKTGDQTPDSVGSVENDEQASERGIRGRRKAPYVSPYKKSYLPSRKSPARSSLTSRTAKSPNTSAKGSVAVLRALPSRLPPTHPSRGARPTIRVPVVTPARGPRPQLVRQATFVKEERPSEDIPATAPSPSRLPQPGRAVPAKANKDAKDATSRIAGLWKRVEQSKKKATEPDKRVWIAAEPARPVTQVQLVRSSTFEGPPRTSEPTLVAAKHKSSLALRMNVATPIVAARPSRPSRVPVVRRART